MKTHDELQEGLKFTKIARAIPTGMRNIDRMREDIHCTVSSVIGLIHPDAIRQFEYYSGESGGYWWQIRVENGTIDVTCLLESKKLDSAEIVYDCVIGKAVRMKDVLHVYEILGTYIASMCELFPELEERLEPIVSAGSVNHELFN